MACRLFLLAFVFIGCSVKQPTLQKSNQNIASLSQKLQNLSLKVDKEEANDLARRSIVYSLKLAQKYKAISLPWIQNTLVNIGFKKRGLCHEWTEDLLSYLVKRNYKTLELHAVGANIGYLNEHNALSVSARAEGIKKSILLDAWRNVGDLYFIEMNRDEKYDWKERRGLYGVLPPKGDKF